VILEKVEPTFEPSRDRIVAVIPAYNEARFIGSVVLQTLQHTFTGFLYEYMACYLIVKSTNNRFQCLTSLATGGIE
jgi:hypothetical protein